MDVMRKRLVVRHGQSTANLKFQNGRPTNESLAFGNELAPLTTAGEQQARERRKTLFAEHGLQTATPVAVSKFLRTQQTAVAMGFTSTTPYPLLNEVDHGIEVVTLRTMLAAGNLPLAAVDAAKRLLDEPPPEDV